METTTRAFLVFLALPLVVVVSGCLVPREPTPDPSATQTTATQGPCDFQTTLGDGTVLRGTDRFWTLTTDQVHVPEAASYLSQIPLPSLWIAERPVALASNAFTWEGSDYIDRHWHCNAKHANASVADPFVLEGPSTGAEKVRLYLMYSGTPAQSETWETEATRLEGTLQVRRPDEFMVQTTLEYENGSSRTDWFYLELRA